MKKRGFVFIETIIVLMVVTLSLTLLIASYTLVSTKSKEKEYYDKIADKYLLYSFSNLGTSSSYNYSVMVDNLDDFSYKIDNKCNYDKEEKNVTEHDRFFYNIFKKNYSTSITTINYTDVNIKDTNCAAVLNELGIKYIYIVSDIEKALKQSDAVSNFDNGTIEYMKSLRKCYDDVYVDGNGFVKDDATVCTNPIQYMIGVFYRNGDYYFASIEL